MQLLAWFYIMRQMTKQSFIFKTSVTNNIFNNTNSICKPAWKVMRLQPSAATKQIERTIDMNLIVLEVSAWMHTVVVICFVRVYAKWTHEVNNKLLISD